MALTPEERAAADQHHERVHWALEHPTHINEEIGPELTEALCWFDATFDGDVTFALTGKPLVDWDTITPARADDPRGDEPPAGPRPSLRHSTSRPLPRDERRATKYAEAVCAGAESDVLDAEHGVRNSALNRAAFRFGQVVAAGFLDEHEAIDRLTACATDAGLGTLEARSTIRSGMRAGVAHPLEAS